MDEFQDVDAAQLRMVRILAEPERNLFVVGDDDQTIYAWRLADVRRILGFSELYPDARRVQLATNYRCPPSVVVASRRLIATNAERFEKRIEATPGRRAEPTAIVMMATGGDNWADRLASMVATEAASGGGCCVLARTRAELTPVALALLRAGRPHATTLPTPLEADPVRALLDAARRLPAGDPPFPSLCRDCARCAAGVAATATMRSATTTTPPSTPFLAGRSPSSASIGSSPPGTRSWRASPACATRLPRSSW